jgi:hypothetical protein
MGSIPNGSAPLQACARQISKLRYRAAPEGASSEHLSNGDKLGIVYRICRTLRELIERYYEITGNGIDNLKHVVKSVVVHTIIMNIEPLRQHQIKHGQKIVYTYHTILKI